MEYNRRTGYIFVKTLSGHTKKVFEQFRSHDWVIGAWAVTGEYDLIAWVWAKNEEDLYTFASTIRAWEGVEFTNSHYVYNGYIATWESLHNPNGAWVRLRGHHVENIPSHLKTFSFVGAWANLPGDYDFLIWTYGNTTRETLENVLHMIENQSFRTFTHIPVYTYVNDLYRNRF